MTVDVYTCTFFICPQQLESVENCACPRSTRLSVRGPGMEEDSAHIFR